MKSVFQSQLENLKTVENLLNNEHEIIAEAPFQREEALESVPTRAQDPRTLEEAVDRLRRGQTDLTAPARTEAIVMLTGYPSLLIKNGTFEQPKLLNWRERLVPKRDLIDHAIANVGRVDLVNDPNAKWIGTGWRVNENTFVTNRHVAEYFAKKRSGTWSVTPGVKVYMDLREEHESDEQLEALVSSILHIEPTGFPDVAIMRVDSTALNYMADPVSLQTGGHLPETIGVIGYPAKAVRDNPVDAMDRYFNDIYNVKRLAPGEIMNADHSTSVFTHNALTLGGNSGSMIIDIDTGCAIGLHFAGSALTQNYAVKIDAVADILTRKSVSFRRDDDGDDAGLNGGGAGSGGVPESSTRFRDRKGYQSDFLGNGSLRIPLPELNSLQVRKLAKTENGETELKYRHFSVVMNGERRLAYYTAVNIDGNELRRPRRSKSFKLDPRLPKDKQAGEDLYYDNDLDRGHLIRRLDPCWGNKSDAKEANKDSMYFPNIAPQHKNLNQKIWLQLEDHILDKTDEADAKISVFVGCLFDDSDPLQKPSGVKVPMGFWKVVASIGRTRRGRSNRRILQAQAFILYQGHLVKPRDLELVFGQGFEEHQVTIEELERLTGHDFGSLREADTFAITPELRMEHNQRLESGSGLIIDGTDHVKPLGSLEDLELG